MGALGLYLAIQVAVPLRHFLYPGNVSWTEEGHNFAWHMKLRDKDGDARFRVTTPSTGRVVHVDPRDYLTRRQYRKMSTRPHMVLEFAHYLSEEYSASAGEPVEVRADVFVSLNGRERQRMIDPDVDLSREPRGHWPKAWIRPLAMPLPSS